MWLPPAALKELLEFRLEAPTAAAAVTGATPPMAQVAAPQLLGVYPNPINEGLGLAHHFVLGRWLEAGAPTVQGTLRAAAA